MLTQIFSLHEIALQNSIAERANIKFLVNACVVAQFQLQVYEGI